MAKPSALFEFLRLPCFGGSPWFRALNYNSKNRTGGEQAWRQRTEPAVKGSTGRAEPEPS